MRLRVHTQAAEAFVQRRIKPALKRAREQEVGELLHNAGSYLKVSGANVWRMCGTCVAHVWRGMCADVSRAVDASARLSLPVPSSNHHGIATCATPNCVIPACPSGVVALAHISSPYEATP
eukprot:350444-Chlamydomonas_euryale.AAC.4